MDLLDPNGYGYLPEQYHRSHDMCEFLVGQLEAFLTEEPYRGLRHFEVDINPEAVPIDDEYTLDYLLRADMKDKHDELVRLHTVYGLLSDSCYFLREALDASMKRRLTVSFALLRKPFIYNMPVLLRLYLDEEFLEHFNNREDFDASKLPKQDLLDLIEASLPMLFSMQDMSRGEIYDILFNKEEHGSLINWSNKALHPATTHHWASLTGAKNLNFMFSTLDDIDKQWEYFYRRLPFLLTYLLECTEQIVFDLLQLNPALYTERLEERAAFFISQGKGGQNA